jgi:hypothetical protein
VAKARVLQRVLLCATLVLLSGASRVGCSGSFYQLTDASAWLEGCIVGPCDCAVAEYEASGWFVLEELPTAQPGPFTLFAVRNVHWRVRRGDRVAEIRGSGLYRTAPFLDQHQLTLDLRMDGVRVPTLDSGLVAGARAFPAIEIRALTPQFCFQQGVALAAKPL